MKGAELKGTVMAKNEFKNRETLLWMAGKTCNTFLNVFRYRFRSDMWGEGPVPNNVENLTKGLYMAISMIVEKGCGWTNQKPSTNAEKDKVVGEVMKGLMALLVKYPLSIGEFGIKTNGFDPDDPLERLFVAGGDSVPEEQEESKQETEQEKHERWEQDEEDEWKDEKERDEQKRIDKLSRKELLKEVNEKIRKAKAKLKRKEEKERKAYNKQAVTLFPILPKSR